MARRADAFLVLPGGLGTLDELCEILTWALLGIHDKPVVLINIAGYWDAFLSMLDAAVAAADVHHAVGAHHFLDKIDIALQIPAMAWNAPRRAGSFFGLFFLVRLVRFNRTSFSETEILEGVGV